MGYLGSLESILHCIFTSTQASMRKIRHHISDVAYALLFSQAATLGFSRLGMDTGSGLQYKAGVQEFKVAKTMI